MTPPQTPEKPANATTRSRAPQDYLRAARRRWRLVLGIALLVPAIATVVGLTQTKLYQASADVLLHRGSLANTLTGAPDPSNSQTDDAIVQTQADLASSPVIALRALAAAGLPQQDLAAFLSSAHVSPKPNALYLTFFVTNPSPTLAKRLATAYAHEYTVYRGQIDTATIAQAYAEVHARRLALQRDSHSSSALVNSLIEKEQQLLVLQALQTSSAAVTRTPTSAAQVQPRLARNGGLALILGLLLGVAAALILDSFDTSIETEEEIAAVLRGPLLARIPPPSVSHAGHHGVQLLSAPAGAYAEVFATLRTSLRFAGLDRNVQVLLITSAYPEDGKSTLSANLAVSYARYGQSVILAELDLRRPVLGEMFGIARGPGVTDVVLGDVTLDEVLSHVELPAYGATARDYDTASGHLAILAAGTLPPEPSDFVGHPGLAGLLSALRERASLVILDTPPLLPVSDAVTLTSYADAVLFLARIDRLRRNALREAGRILSTCQAPCLGFVLGTPPHSIPHYGYGTYEANQADPTAGPRLQSPVRNR